MNNKLKWVKEWFRKAENDLTAARMIIQNEHPPTDTICFHCQQCAEKYLKGYLTFQNIQIERTHDLVKLNNSCRKIDDSFGELAEVCEILTGYAVEVRYPGDFYDYPLEDARQSVKFAETIRDFVLQKTKCLG